MCFEYEWEYHLKRAEEARKEMQRLEEQRKQPKPASPASAPEEDVKPEPVFT